MSDPNIPLFALFNALELAAKLQSDADVNSVTLELQINGDVSVAILHDPNKAPIRKRFDKKTGHLN